MNQDERESVINEQITAIGQESFPDNPDVDWEVLEIKHEGPYAFVEALPHPDEIGAARFMFVLTVDDVETAHCVGCYDFEAEWGLLFDDPGAPTDWKHMAAAPAPPRPQPAKAVSNDTNKKKPFWKFW